MKTTKAELITENARLSKENTVLFLALSDLAKGTGKAFPVKGEAITLTITRPDSACGGIVILNESGTCYAHYWEEFSRAALEHIALVITGENNAHNRGLLARREAIQTAQAYVSAAQRAA